MGTSSTSMKCDSSGQALVNSMMTPPISVTSNHQRSNELGKSGPDIGVVNGIDSQSIGPEKGVINGINFQAIGPDIATREFNAQLKDNDGELSKFNSEEPTMLILVVNESSLV
ncbi:hypothetical protein CMV_004776 [Castanea mollissima]|uniref:Uncharacterized protein n=1 Tax=Castanea mollissima TaxID=60419 RepID=A0A8J4RYA3_9ROSI|nr:hypothetical protein CMV_004776 [Castanea mollissima]